MVQILTVRYTKEEERTVLTSNLLGILIGIPIGVLLDYSIGFYADMKLAAFSSIEWAVLWLKTGSTTVAFSWVATILISVLLWKKKDGTKSTPEAAKMMISTLLFPLTLTYGFIITGLIIFPLCFLLLDYINRPTAVMLIGSLALLPFVFIIIALLLPESPAGKSLRRFVHRLTGQTTKT